VCFEGAEFAQVFLRLKAVKTMSPPMHRCKLRLHSCLLISALCILLSHVRQVSQASQALQTFSQNGVICSTQKLLIVRTGNTLAQTVDVRRKGRVQQDLYTFSRAVTLSFVRLRACSLLRDGNGVTGSQRYPVCWVAGRSSDVCLTCSR
jgi:hypothetical protein